jgi:hypothetical protein
MTAKEMDNRNEKAQQLKVIRANGDYYVESSEGKIAYKVSISNGERSCTCGDFTSNSKKDPAFNCKHILAAMNYNGNALMAEVWERSKPKLDERFITSIQGKEFVVYAGLLDLAHQRGLRSITVEVIQYPTKENGSEAICKAIVESRSGEVFIEWGDSNPRNTNAKIVNHILRMAATRAKARALRDFTNIGMTCLEELGDFDEVLGDDASHTNPSRSNHSKRSNSSKRTDNGQSKAASAPPQANQSRSAKESTQQSSDASTSTASSKKPAASRKEAEQDAGPKPSTAQMKAIENLARRRNITTEELEEMVQQQFGTTLANITTSEASNFIRILQQSA